ncbi:hypothetical protein J7L05_10145 [bacterium]|nr:hypothetical protein [bacterium]
MNPDKRNLFRRLLTDVNLCADHLIRVPLMTYQRPIADSITRTILRGDSGIITVEMPRQSGKNQVSATCELFLLLQHYLKGGNLIKTAPTFQPQLTISRNRLAGLLDSCLVTRKRWKSKDGNTITLGKAKEIFLSAQPGANVVGATADIALFVDEGQEMDVEKFERDFSPMRAWKNTSTVVFGVRWNGESFLERLIETNLELEKKDGVKRHFRVEPEQVMEVNPDYQKHFERERARLGEDHVLFRTQYLLESVSAMGNMFTPAQVVSMQGDFPRLDSPREGNIYFIGIDVGGESISDESHDETIMVVCEKSRDRANDQVRLVNCYRWQGANWETLHRELLVLLDLWRPQSVTVDGRGIGNACAIWINEHYRRGNVEIYQATSSSVSSDGYQLMSFVNLNRLKIFRDGDKPASDGIVSNAEIIGQFANARRELVSGGLMRFFVPERFGHDDILKAAAYAVRASRNSEGTYENIILKAVIEN